MAKKYNQSYKRRARVAGIGELASKLLEPHLRKRGFASRELLTRWGAIAPAPYDKVSIPDRLVWRRGQEGAQGALLFLRCEEAHRLLLVHDTELITGAVNRYFGYLLVDTLKLSAEPFTPGSDEKVPDAREPSNAQRARVEAELAGISDEKLKKSLRKLGLGLAGGGEKKSH